jgi:hypothetical protein
MKRAVRGVLKDDLGQHLYFLYLRGCFCPRDQVFLDQNYLE